jgi:phosphopantetheine--protein transferase-like protein
MHCGELMGQWNVGVDVIEVGRFDQLDYSSHRQFYSRFFTSNEINYCLSFCNPAPHFAVTFAGKEAVYKAVNKFCSVKLHGIEILRDKNGIPFVNLHLGRNKFGTLDVRVSLSHSFSQAVAFAIARFDSSEDNHEIRTEGVSSNGL